MKHLLVLLNTMIIVLILMFSVNMYLTVKELEKEITDVQQIQNAEIEELKKEIRVMKTDLDIFSNGYEK